MAYGPLSWFKCPTLKGSSAFFFFFHFGLQPVKIVSLILSQANRKVERKREIPEKKKTPDHLQAELGLSHV